MKQILSTNIFLFFIFGYINAQVDQYDPACSTPDLDSATAVSLPWYNNNQFLENYLIQKGYNSLPYISFPAPAARATTTTFLEPMFLMPLNIYIYRDGANNPNSSITESDARDYVCRVNEIFRNAGTAIQFYTNFVKFEGNEFFNNKISSKWEVYDLWSRKRFTIPALGNGINVHFIRYNNAPENNAGKASLPYYPVLPYSNYSLYVRTHEVYSDGTRGVKRSAIANASTLAHEIGHTLSLLHTHHPGRLPSLIFNETNATISNGCYQESVSRVKSNYWYNGCLFTDGLAKCGINGDFLCDTDADPRQSGLVSGCTFIPPASGDYRTDNWGDVWTPPTRNVMSYSNNACLNQFSRHQTAIMWRQMEHFRTFITYQTPVVSSSSNTICTNSNTSFTLTGTLPNDAVVRWDVEPSNLVNVSSGMGRVANISASSSSSMGSLKIIFTMIGPGNCYIARIQKTAWVGNPKADNNTIIWTGIRGTNPVSLYAGSINNYRIDLVPYTTYYSWILPSGFSAYGPSSSTTSPFISLFTSNNNGQYTLMCRVENNCGFSYAKGLTINVIGGSSGGGGGCKNCGGGGGGIQMRAAFPNPANDSFIVKIKEEDNSETADVSIFNKNMERVFYIRTTEKEVTVNATSLQSGVYFLHIIYDKEVLHKQLVISH
jgi:hypothetical protein